MTKIRWKVKKLAIQNGRPGRSLISKKKQEKTQKDPPTQLELEKNTENQEKERHRATRCCVCYPSLEYVSEDPKRAYDTPMDYPQNSGNWMKNSNVLIPDCFFLINVA